jgi:cysteine desulfuration protein SufE
MPTIERISDDFDLLGDWEERYRHLIDLGRGLQPLDEAEHSEANRVRGCASQVWLVTDPQAQGRLRFRGDSDAHIVKGLIAITLALFSDRKPTEILATDAGETYRRLGLSEHLTPQRSNGVRAMVERIKADARAAAGVEPVSGQA